MREPDQQDPELWVRDYANFAEDMSRKAEEAQARFADIEGEGSNIYVQVKVNSGGVIDSVRFSSQVRQIGEKDLADRFMDAYSVAVTAVNGQTEAYVRDMADGDEAMADYVRGIVPESMRERAERAREEQS